MNSMNVTTWLVKQLLQLYWYCADHSQLSQSLSSLSEVEHHCSIWNLAPQYSCDIFYASKVCLYVIETYCHSSFTFWAYFVFLLLIFCRFLEPNWHFKFWKWWIVMDFSLLLSYILWDICIWNILNCCNLQTLCYKSVRNCARCKCK
jgi:hypothetical protein